MKSVLVRKFGGPEVVEVVDAPVPEPGPRDVRIRVAASSINPIDLSARSGRLAAAGLMPDEPGIGLGWDVAGYVDKVGTDVRRFAAGDSVIGIRDLLFAGGAHAEYIVLDESAIAHAPTSVSMIEAATVPLNALTADRSLKLTGLLRGQSLLVTGAAGAVGGYVLEMAAIRGIKTVALARENDEKLTRELGAFATLHSTDQLGAAIRQIFPGGVDAVIDAAVLGIHAHNALRDEGTFVTLVAPFSPPKIRGTNVVVQEVAADGARLTELSAMVGAGLLTPRVGKVLPLSQAQAAHRIAENAGLRGRVVLQA